MNAEVEEEVDRDLDLEAEEVATEEEDRKYKSLMRKIVDHDQTLTDERDTDLDQEMILEQET
jgi:hypothetical protein